MRDCEGWNVELFDALLDNQRNIVVGIFLFGDNGYWSWGGLDQLLGHGLNIEHFNFLGFLVVNHINLIFLSALGGDDAVGVTG